MTGYPQLGIDAWWHGLMGSVATPVLTSVSLFFNVIGQGILGFVVIPLILAGVLAKATGWRTAAFLIMNVLASFAAAQLLKHIVERPRPSNMMVPSDMGSFPSGHVANAATIAVVLVFTIRSRWMAIVTSAYVLVMFFSRTYLNEHWLTDTSAGLLMGAAVPVITAQVRDHIRHRGAQRQKPRAERG